MTKPLRSPSPRTLARVVGLLELTIIAAGIIAQMFISDRIVVWDDAAATATNISTERALFQLGFTIYLIEMAAQVAQTAVFYLLLRPVSRSVSLVALAVGLVGCTIKTLSRLFFIAPLLTLGEARYLAVFSSEQQQALALLLLDVNDQGAGMALPFLGLATLLNGYLVFRSGFLPRVLGVLLVAGGLGWLAFVFAPLGLQLYPYILVVALLGSATQILWLLILGVNSDQWHRRTAEAA
jgi:hypothetical protein